MRNSLLVKFTLAFVLLAILTAGLVAVFIRFTSVDRLSNLILDQERSTLQSSLAEYYSQTGSWNRIDQRWSDLRSRPGPPRGPAQNEGHGYSDNTSGGDRPRIFGLADAGGQVLIPVDQSYPAGSILPVSMISAGTPVQVNGQQVGTILTLTFRPRLNPEENLFLQRTNQALLMAMGGAALIAVLLGMILARTLVRPLHALTEAAQSIAAGQLEQQVTVTSKDEIGQLAVAFNRMSQEVTRVNQLRRQMTADIAHDLRTPLTVIAGYIESMRDGVLQPTPQRLTLIYGEIERLQNLVGDLKMLSQVDAGELPLHPRPTDPAALLEYVAAPFITRAEQQGVRLTVETPPGSLPKVAVDEARMMQVFGNLISNALRYTPEGGKITLRAEAPAENAADGMLRLSVDDTGEGIAADELPLVFDRFHRADQSRHSETGESGLGLAIVKALVEAHGGRVWAESQTGHGTQIHIELPEAAGS